MNAQSLGRLGLSLAAALTGAVLAPVAFAQVSPSGEAPEGPPLYRVEIIVFAYAEGDRSEEDFAHIARTEALDERGPAELLDFPYADDEEEDLAGDGEASPGGRLLLGQDDAADADVPPVPGSAPPASTDPAAGDQVGPVLDPDGAEAEIDPFGGDPGNAVAAFRFRLLGQDELELAGLRQRLERLPEVYTPLVHGGWIQEGLPPEQAKPFDLAYLGASVPSGTIRLHVRNFLHLTLDLDYRPFIASPSTALAAPDSRAAPLPAAPGAGPAATEFPGGDFPGDRALGDERSAPVLGAVRPPLSAIEVSRRYHLNAERRVRSGEVHYFDHPFFGVIAVVEPYEPPAPPQTGSVRPAA